MLQAEAPRRIVKRQELKSAHAEHRPAVERLDHAYKRFAAGHFVVAHLNFLSMTPTPPGAASLLVWKTDWLCTRAAQSAIRNRTFPALPDFAQAKAAAKSSSAKLWVINGVRSNCDEVIRRSAASHVSSIRRP